MTVFVDEAGEVRERWSDHPGRHVRCDHPRPRHIHGCTERPTRRRRRQLRKPLLVNSSSCASAPATTRAGGCRYGAANSAMCGLRSSTGVPSMASSPRTVSVRAVDPDQVARGDADPVGRPWPAGRRCRLRASPGCRVGAGPRVTRAPDDLIEHEDDIEVARTRPARPSRRWETARRARWSASTSPQSSSMASARPPRTAATGSRVTGSGDHPVSVGAVSMSSIRFPNGSSMNTRASTPQRLVPTDRHAGRTQPGGESVQVVDVARGWALRGGSEVRLDSEVQLCIAAHEPAAAAVLRERRASAPSEPELADVERDRLVLAHLWAWRAGRGRYG